MPTPPLWRLQIRRIREQQGLSRAALAKRVDPPLSPSTITKLERGTIDPKASTLARVGEALGFTLHFRSLAQARSSTYRKQLAKTLAVKYESHTAELIELILADLFGPSTQP